MVADFTRFPPAAAAGVRKELPGRCPCLQQCKQFNTNALFLGPFKGNLVTEYTIIYIHNDARRYSGSCIYESTCAIQALSWLVAYWMRIIFAYQSVQHAPNYAPDQAPIHVS